MQKQGVAGSESEQEATPAARKSSHDILPPSVRHLGEEIRMFMPEILLRGSLGYGILYTKPVRAKPAPTGRGAGADAGYG